MMILTLICAFVLLTQREQDSAKVEYIDKFCSIEVFIFKNMKNIRDGERDCFSSVSTAPSQEASNLLEVISAFLPLW